MAAGARLLGLSAGLLTGATSPSRIAAEGARGLTGEAPPRPGSLTRHQPISIRSIAAAGQRQRSFFDDWYNRIHVTPKLIEYGVVARDTARSVLVWNAYLGNSTLGSLSLLNDGGITISGYSLPKTFKQFEATTFTLTAAQDGPAQIQSNLRFNFTNRSDAPLVTMTGSRARLFQFSPNWRESTFVAREFKTDIFTSRSGHEQRRALRGEPRKNLEFTIGIYRDKLLAFQRLMAKWQSRPIVMGDPTRSSQLREAAASGDLTILLSSVPQWALVNQTLILEDGDQRELVVVKEIDEATITLAAPLAHDWSGTALLRPVLSGLLTSDISQSLVTNDLAEVKISFAVDPGSEPVITSEPQIFIHAGREVFPFNPNWAQDVSNTLRWPTETIDMGFGRIESLSPLNFGTVVRQSAFLGRTAEEGQQMSDFFERQKGQQGEFYWPSGMNDLPLAAPLVGGTNYLRTSGTDVYDAFANDTVYCAVQVLLSDGRRLFRSVTSITSDFGDSVVHFEKPWLADIQVADVEMVSWLTVARFASDQFTAEWLTNEVMQTQIATTTLEDFPAEDPIPDYSGAAQWALESWGAEAFIRVFDKFDWLVNVEYPAIFFIPEAWVARNESDVDSFDVLINVTYPGIFD